jgi:hypothetical protein
MSLILKEIKPTIEESAHAFQIFSRPGVSDENGNPTVYIVTIAPGTVNNILPQNIIDNNGVLTEFQISLNTLNYVKLFFNTNGKSINSATVFVDSKVITQQVATAFSLPTSAEYLLGVVYNGQIYQLISTNLNLGGKVQYVLKATEPGALPFVPYLTWT